jgi:hypothetical protein
MGLFRPAGQQKIVSARDASVAVARVKGEAEQCGGRPLIGKSIFAHINTARGRCVIVEIAGR